MGRRKILLLGLALVLISALVAGCGTQAQPPANGNGDLVDGIDSLEMVSLITAEWQESGKQFAMSYAAGRSANTCASCHDGYGFSK